MFFPRFITFCAIVVWAMLQVDAQAGSYGVVACAGGAFQAVAQGCCLQSGADATFQTSPTNVLTCNYVNNFQLCFQQAYPNACILTLTDGKVSLETPGCKGLINTTDYVCNADASLSPTKKDSGATSGGISIGGAVIWLVAALGCGFLL